MNYTSITLELEGSIALLTINRPKALNALNKSVFDELEAFFGTDYKSIEKLSGVIITGSGEKSFVAGADIKEFEGLDKAGGSALASRGQGIFDLIEQFHAPVIAAVNGYALGGGCELAMACHIRIASEKARFGQPEVNLGLTPGYAGTQRLTQLVGKAKAIELLITADMVKADEALRLGLANHVVPHGEEVAFAKSILEKVATKAPIAVAQCIACVNAYYDKDASGTAAEIEAFGVCFDTEDFVEGTTAFVEKRAATFKGK